MHMCITCACNVILKNIRYMNEDMFSRYDKVHPRMVTRVRSRCKRDTNKLTTLAWLVCHFAQL